jgi:hypothetical protein
MTHTLHGLVVWFLIYPYPAHRSTPIIRRIFKSIVKGARIDKREIYLHLARGQEDVSATTGGRAEREGLQ